MGKMITAAVTLVTALFLVGLLVPAVSAEPAEAPAWQKGDRWALGWDTSFSAKNNATVNQALAQAVSSMTGMSFEEASAQVSTNAAIYALFEVTGVNDTAYVVSTKIAVKMEADMDASVSGQLPKAGTYNVPSPYLIPAESKEAKTIRVVLGADFAFVLEGTTVFNKSLAIESVDLSAKASAIISFDATNLPMFNNDEGQYTVAYQNYDIDAKLVFSLDVNVLFEPQPLDLFGLDLYDGKEWDVNTVANISGEIGGFLDVKGLSEEMQEDFFDNELMKEAGVTAFPIKFVDLIPEDSKLSDGKFGAIERNIDLSFSANESESGIYEITVMGADEDGEDQVNGELQVPPGSGEIVSEQSRSIGLKYYYDPDQRFLSGAGVSMSIGDVPIDLSDFMPFMEPVSVSKAQSEINSIENFQADVEKRAGSDNITDFFFDPPYIGLILIVVAAVVVGGVLFMVTRARKK